MDSNATIEIWGWLSLAVMVTAYALERHSPLLVLLFALACVSASAYAAVTNVWVFSVLEAIWAVIAIGRWSQLARRSYENRRAI